jgi:hypothetical protein
MWAIHLRCQLGGTYSPVGAPIAHQQGELLNLIHYFNNTNSSLTLDKYYSWINCNKNFASYLVTSYDDKNFEALNYVMRARPEVNLSRPLASPRLFSCVVCLSRSQLSSSINDSNSFHSISFNLIIHLKSKDVLARRSSQPLA